MPAANISKIELLDTFDEFRQAFNLSLDELVITQNTANNALPRAELDDGTLVLDVASVDADTYTGVSGTFTNLTLDDRITSKNDTDTFLQFDTGNSFRVVRNGANTLEVDENGVTCVSGFVHAGSPGSGRVSLTIDDGHGNANVAFNHSSGIPDSNGSSARIESLVDGTTAGLNFELANDVTAGQSVNLTPILSLRINEIIAEKNTKFKGTTSTDGNATFNSLVTVNDDIKFGNVADRGIFFGNGSDSVGYIKQNTSAGLSIGSDDTIKFFETDNNSERVTWSMNASTYNFNGTITTDVLNTTDNFKVPVGNTAARPASPADGNIRYNTETSQYEGYSEAAWSSIGGGAQGSQGNQVFFENDVSVTSDYTITTGKNAMSAGPVTVEDGVVVTIPEGSVWSIV